LNQLNTKFDFESAFGSWKSLVEQANQAYAEERFAVAETVYADALKEARAWPKAEAETIQREVDARLSKSLNNMAALCHTQGKYKMAEDLYLEALAIKEKLYGEEHEEVALNVQNLAMMYGAKRNYAQAEIFFQRALTIREKLLGVDHPDLAPTLSNYALLLRKQGRADESQQFESRAKDVLAKRAESLDAG
jgi:tetratricopeptide (TPR) repeat protein